MSPSRFVVSAALLVQSMGCAHAPVVRTPCGRTISNLDAVTGAGRTLILGELHGTREIPEAAGAIACEASERGPVVLGLELPPEALVRTSPLWSQPSQDGRTSEAMAALLERVASWRREGRPIEVLGFDGNETTVESRDTVMAATLARHRAERPDATFVLLMGNLHARRQIGSPWNPKDGHRWLASQLTFPVTTLDVAAPRGTAWICGGATPETCGPKTVSTSKGGASNSIQLRSDGVYDGVLDLSSLTASPPATSKPADFDLRLAGLKAQNVALEAYLRGDFEGCLAALESPVGAEALYMRGCCLVRAGKVQAAFEALNGAVTAGFTDRESLEVDEDLQALRADPRWAALVGRLSP